MKFDEYQKEAWRFAVQNEGLRENLLFGLAEETGETMGVFKRLARGDLTTSAFEAMLSKELGDTLWYVAAVAKYHGISLEEIAKRNLAKLEDRAARDAIVGSGDDR